VALFAALSYAVTSSSRTSDGGVSSEKAELIASQIIQYATGIEQAVTRMRIIGKVPLENIDVSLTGFTSQTANSNCSDDTCRLFAPDGRGAIAKFLPDEAVDATATNSNNRLYFMIAGIQNVGSDLPELLLVYRGVNNNICHAINRKMQINDSDGELNSDNHRTFAQHQGNLIPYPNPSGILGDAEPKIIGKSILCVPHGATLFGNYFYHVLVSR
jgi:hypothetical protein